jgi:hypothetical protein
MACTSGAPCASGRGGDDAVTDAGAVDAGAVDAGAFSASLGRASDVSVRISRSSPEQLGNPTASNPARDTRARDVLDDIATPPNMTLPSRRVRCCRRHGLRIPRTHTNAATVSTPTRTSKRRRFLAMRRRASHHAPGPGVRSGVSVHRTTRAHAVFHLLAQHVVVARHLDKLPRSTLRSPFFTFDVPLTSPDRRGLDLTSGRATVRPWHARMSLVM